MELGDRGTRLALRAHLVGRQIGAGTSLGQNVFVGRGVRVGARVKVQNNVSLYEGVEIDDEVFVGPSAVFTNVVNPRADVERKHAFRRTRVGRGASIGANATIVCGHDIGAYAFVGAGATVTRDVPAYALVVGSPARQTAWMCVCGEKLARVDARGAQRCAACGRAYSVSDAACSPGRSASRRGQGGAYPSHRSERAERATAARLRAAFERVMDSATSSSARRSKPSSASCARQFGFAHAIGVSSGTDALLLALMALDIGPGDEVITTPVLILRHGGLHRALGASPCSSISITTAFRSTQRRVERAISAKTKAMLPVHLFGQAADMGRSRHGRKARPTYPRGRGAGFGGHVRGPAR